MSAPKVFIILLNWNNSEETLACLKSLQGVEYSNFEVIIVDNGSSEEEREKLKKRSTKYEVRITVLEHKENLGFAGGNNVGIKYSAGEGADYVLLLNNDTAVRPDFLYKLVEFGEKNRKVGIFAPVIYDWNNNIWFAGGKINWWKMKEGITHRICRKSHFLHNVGSETSYMDGTDFITGAAMMIRRDVVEEIGLMDDRFFLYFEDVDYSLRAKSAGWKLAAVPAAKIWHKVSATTLPKLGSPRVQYYHHRNFPYLAAKHAPFYINIIKHLWLAQKLTKQYIKVFLGRDREVSRAIINGIRDYYINYANYRD